jgi:hypothetical protein
MSSAVPSNSLTPRSRSQSITPLKVSARKLLTAAGTEPPSLLLLLPCRSAAPAPAPVLVSALLVLECAVPAGVVAATCARCHRVSRNQSQQVSRRGLISEESVAASPPVRPSTSALAGWAAVVAPAGAVLSDRTHAAG